jgi:hypothetical protein
MRRQQSICGWQQCDVVPSKPPNAVLLTPDLATGIGIVKGAKKHEFELDVGSQGTKVTIFACLIVNASAENAITPWLLFYSDVS